MVEFGCRCRGQQDLQTIRHPGDTPSWSTCAVEGLRDFTGWTDERITPNSRHE